MFLNRFLVRCSLIFLPLLFAIGSCKKKKAFKEEKCQTTQDLRMASGQKDEIIMDVNLAIITQSLLTGRGFSRSEANAAARELCGVNLDTSNILSGILKLNYTGAECGTRKKTGQIILSFMNYPSQKWKHQGCVIQLEFNSYKVTGTDGNSVVHKGKAFLTNESGNSWYEMRYLHAATTIQTYSSEDEILSYGSTSTIFSFKKKMKFSYSAGITTCVVEGLGFFNGKGNLESWGQSREGNDYTSQVLSPIVWKSSCKGSTPLDGEVIFKEDGKDFEMKCKFGVDNEGNTISDYSFCPFGWKISWSHKKKTRTRIVGYE